MKNNLKNLNISKNICNHFLGENHTASHRMFCGFGVMIVGVLVSHVSSESSIIIIKILGDLSGYAIHGLGVLPYAEYLTTLIKK